VILRISVRPITVKVVVLANQLHVDYSGDPCDRRIGATTLAEGIALETKGTKTRACKQLTTI
jgi:PIN domain nuclease of toxin-antitoxin system